MTLSHWLCDSLTSRVDIASILKTTDVRVWQLLIAGFYPIEFSWAELEQFWKNLFRHHIMSSPQSKDHILMVCVFIMSYLLGSVLCFFCQCVSVWTNVGEERETWNQRPSLQWIAFVFPVLWQRNHMFFAHADDCLKRLGDVANQLIAWCQWGFAKMQNDTPFAPEYRKYHSFILLFVPMDAALCCMFSANLVPSVHAVALTIPEACRHTSSKCPFIH